MARRPVRLLGDPVLREKARPVEAFDAELRGLVDDMFETMDAEEGAGLAAPQIGVSLRVIVVDDRTETEEGRFAMINPSLMTVSPLEETEMEGCLSIPGVSESVRRPAFVEVAGFDLEGRAITISGDGLRGRALLHELEHLDGVLFIDHLSPLKRDLLLKKYRKLQER